MKISDLLTQKLTIDSWNIATELSAINQKLSLMQNTMAAAPLSDLSAELAVISADMHNVIFDLTVLDKHITEIKSAADKLMNTLAHDPLYESYTMYEERKNWFNNDEAEKYRKLDEFIDFEEYENRFKTLIRKFTSWEYPTVYIRPNSLRFFDAFKSSDILYVMEQCDITKWLKENLPEGDYNAIRFKLIDENKDQFLTATLPAEQIGLIVMEHFMHFKPLEVIKQYLIESLILLKPGGHLLFTYNNCDLPSGAKKFEQGLYCFTPGVMLGKICEALGFEIVNTATTDRVSWFALKKPGELTSIKGGKTLGQIINNNSQST